MALRELTISYLQTNQLSKETLQHYLLRAKSICQQLQLPQAAEIHQLQLNLTDT